MNWGFIPAAASTGGMCWANEAFKRQTATAAAAAAIASGDGPTVGAIVDDTMCCCWIGITIVEGGISAAGTGVVLGSSLATTSTNISSWSLSLSCSSPPPSPDKVCRRFLRSVWEKRNEHR